MNEPLDWTDALSGIRDEIRDVRGDVAQLRFEVSEIKHGLDEEKSERRAQADDFRTLHADHRELSAEVTIVHNDVDLLKENMRLTQMINDKTHTVTDSKIDRLTIAFEKHAQQEELDRREVIKALKSENFAVRRNGTVDFLWAVGIAVTVGMAMFGMLMATGTVGGS